MTDIVERLRNRRRVYINSADLCEAADEIERLRAHLAHAAGFCEGMARRLEAGDVEHAAEDCHEYGKIARRALEAKE